MISGRKLLEDGLIASDFSIDLDELQKESTTDERGLEDLI